MIITIGIALRYVELHAKDNKYWLSLVAQDSKKLKFPLLFHLQVSNVVYEQSCLNYLKLLLRDFGIFFSSSGEDPFGWLGISHGLAFNYS